MFSWCLKISSLQQSYSFLLDKRASYHELEVPATSARVTNTDILTTETYKAKVVTLATFSWTTF